VGHTASTASSRLSSGAVGEGNVAQVDEFGLHSLERPRLDPATGATGRVLESDDDARCPGRPEGRLCLDAVDSDGTEGTADEIRSDTPTTAGDEYVTRNEAQAESEVRVIWSSENGSVATTLAQATV
jgi:hypothetical protein